MEVSDLVNTIADALTEFLGKDVYAIANSTKDSKFPVYVKHVITVNTFDGEWSTRIEKRVHGGEINKEQVFRELATTLLVSLLRSTAQGELSTHKQELKF